MCRVAKGMARPEKPPEIDPPPLIGLDAVSDRVIRPVAPADAAELAALYRANRDFLVPFLEIRDNAFFTTDGQRERIERVLEAAAIRESWRFAILDGDSIAGTIGLTNVVRGPLQCAKLGYWVDR